MSTGKGHCHFPLRDCIVARSLIVILSLFAVLMFSLFAQEENKPGSSQKDFDLLRNRFQFKLDELGIARAKLKEQFQSRLVRERKEAQLVGDLDRIVWLDDAVQAVDDGVPISEASRFEDLERLSDLFTTKTAQLVQKERSASIPLLSKYLESLKALQVSLAQENRIEAAKLVQEEWKARSELLSEAKKLLGRADATTDYAKLTGLSEEFYDELDFYFDFDHPPADGLIQDSSQNGREAHLIDVDWTDLGKRRGAVIFNEKYAKIEVHPSLPDTENLTLAAWVKYTATKGRSGILFSDFDESSGNDLCFGLVNESTFFLQSTKSGNSLRSLVPVEVKLANDWFHIVWVMRSRRSTIYVNAERVAIVKEEASNVGHHGTSIGYGSDNSGRSHFHGVLDDFMLWSRALEHSEIQLLFRELGGKRDD